MNLNGCAAFAPGFFTDKLALIQRGACTFATKVNNASAAGALAVVVFNNAGGPPIIMGSLGGTLIPSVMITLDDGLAGIWTFLRLHSGMKMSKMMGWAPAAVQRGFAFLLVLIGWVLFRCDTLGHAGALLSGMAGFNGVGAQFIGHLKSVPLSCAMLAVTLGMVWALPNKKH